MPIPAANIPLLIKAVQEKKLPTWLRDYFKRIADSLQVHTKGIMFDKIDTLFPNEGEASKAHCVATYEPITKSSIWKGINNLARIFSNSSFSINVSPELKEWLDDYQHDGNNLIHYFLELWINKAVAEDPNGIFVVYPPEWAEARGMCPVQFIRSELIRSCGYLDDGTEYFAFVSEHESEVTYDMETVVAKRELFYDDSVEKVNAKTLCTTTYNQKLKLKVVKGVVHVVTLDGILIYDENIPADTVKWETAQFPDQLTNMPLFAGGGPVADRAKMPIYESFVQAFVPFGNLSLLQHRSHRAVDLQFSYPRMSELQMPCDNHKCAAGKVKMPDATTVNCSRCAGTGFVTVQSPYKVYGRRYNPSDEGENKHLDIPAVEFYSPDVAIVQYSKEAWKDYLKMAEEAIFILQKIMTGNVQSEESKRLDLDDMHAWLLNVSKVFYNNTRIMLQALEDYQVRNPIAVSVEKPYSFAILTEEAAFVALTNILGSNAPVFIKGNQVENFVNKFVSKSSPIVRALGVLKQYDPLLYYSTSEVQTFKATNVVTAEMVTRHVLGYPTLLKLYEQDPAILEQTDEQIIAQLDTEIATFNIQAAATTLQQTLRNVINQPAA